MTDPKPDELAAVEDLETGTRLITSDDPLYASYLAAARRGGMKAVGAKFNGAIVGQRKVLSMDELLAGRNHRMRFEQSFPEIRSPSGEMPHFYTVDITLQGTHITGCMLAGSCALVFARTRRAADDLAQAGLQTTLEAGFDYANGPIDRSAIDPELEFGGRRGDPTPINPDTLHTDVRTKDAIISRFDRKKH